MGGEGAVSQMKNHEGYHDPTAGKAIQRFHRAKRRGRGTAFHRPLTYKVGDLPRCICTLLAEQTKRGKVCRI